MAMTGERRRLGLIHVGLFLTMGVVLPYMPVWLAERGLNGEQVGLVLAVGMLARAVGSIAAGLLADVLARSVLIMRVSALAMAAAYVAHWPFSTFAALMIMSALAGLAMGPIGPLLASVSIEVGRRRGFAYGPVRSVGSLTFIAASIVGGWSLTRLGVEATIAWAVAGSLGCAAAMWGMAEHAPEGSARRPRLADIARELTRADPLVAFAVVALIQGAHGFYYSFSALLWAAAGHSETVIGVLWGWGVICEVMVLAALARWTERMDPAVLMMIGGLAGLVRWAGLAFDPALPIAFALQSLHGGTFAATFVAFVIYANRRIA
ncbi:MAG: MFS transporter, partial [Caulobacterales bacterium]|nr:MFS transporter [Caulobacterales bacterium]